MITEIRIAITVGSVVVAFIGLFFVAKTWMVWMHTDQNVLRARVFLNRDFLVKNWLLVFLAGAFITIRWIAQLLDLMEYHLNDVGTVLLDILGFAVIVLLVVLAYYWYTLLYPTLNAAIEEKQ